MDTNSGKTGRAAGAGTSAAVTATVQMSPVAPAATHQATQEASASVAREKRSHEAEQRLGLPSPLSLALSSFFILELALLNMYRLWGNQGC